MLPIDIATYVAEDFQREDLAQSENYEPSEPDSDLNKEIYNEYWENMPRKNPL